MFFFKRQLKNLATKSAPSADFRSRLKTELLVEFEQEYGRLKPRSFGFRFASIMVASFVIFFTAGASVYAYESPTVIEGHPLHFVKVGIETVQGGIAYSPETRAQFHASMMRRRIQEGEHCVPRCPEHIPPSLEAAAKQFEETIQALEEGVQDEGLRNALIEQLSLQQTRYQDLSLRVVNDEGESSGYLEGLRMRIEGHQIPGEELMRLFGPGPYPGGPFNEP